MNKKIKNMLSVASITALTASSILPVNALCKNNNTKCVIYRNVYMCINGVKFKLSLTPECPNIECKPQFKPCDSNKPSTDTNSSGNTSTNKPDTNVNDNTTIDKPNTNTNSNGNTNIDKPSSNTNSNDNTTTNKPSDNNTTNNNTTVKPQEKPVTNNTDFSAYQQQVLNLVNIERTKRGLSPLTFDSNLSNVATKKSQDMVDKKYFDHTSPTYGSPFDMMNRFGVSYQAAGENIAKGQKTPEEVMNSWMNSSGHRANILSSNFTKLGIGIAKDSNGTLYWTQMFVG